MIGVPMIQVDGTRWYFEPDRALHFEERTYWTGEQYVSAATHSALEHEELYLCESGRWVIGRWHASPGELVVQYIEIPLAEAAAWLMFHERAPVLEPPEEETPAQAAALESARELLDARKPLA